MNQKSKKQKDSYQYKINMSRTSHRGDSGMKNNPGINIVHGRIPTNEV